MNDLVLPTAEEILFAMSEQPLGEGAEAKVYKIHTSPKFTVRVCHECPPINELAQIIKEKPCHKQKNIFGERNFAQTLAYWEHPIHPDMPLLTINFYCPGISIEVHKSGRLKPEPEEALIRTKVLSEKILNMPDSSIDFLYDDLHFLSAHKHSIDVGGGLFNNTGNILYSAVDNRMFIIDLQPFIQGHPGISNTQKKGFNTPLFLARGLLPGAYCYREEHSKDPDLIELRTAIVNKVISGAERNKINDVGGYLRGDMDKMLFFWNLQLKNLNISEKYKDNMLARIGAIKDYNRYTPVNGMPTYIRVSGLDL